MRKAVASESAVCLPHPMHKVFTEEYSVVHGWPHPKVAPTTLGIVGIFAM